MSSNTRSYSVNRIIEEEEKKRLNVIQLYLIMSASRSITTYGTKSFQTIL